MALVIIKNLVPKTSAIFHWICLPNYAVICDVKIIQLFWSIHFQLKEITTRHRVTTIENCIHLVIFPLIKDFNKKHHVNLPKIHEICIKIRELFYDSSLEWIFFQAAIGFIWKYVQMSGESKHIIQLIRMLCILDFQIFVFACTQIPITVYRKPKNDIHYFNCLISNRFWFKNVTCKETFVLWIWWLECVHSKCHRIKS